MQQAVAVAVADESPRPSSLSQRLQDQLSRDLLLFSELTGHNFERRVPTDPKEKREYLDSVRALLMKRYHLSRGNMSRLIGLYSKTDGPSAVRSELIAIIAKSRNITIS